jgi:hypothetical protein
MDDKKRTNPDIRIIEIWIKDVVHRYPVDPNNENDMDQVLLYSRPLQLTTLYTRMKAYGNHFRVEDQQSGTLQTFDSGVASVFHISSLEPKSTTLNYVEVLKIY